MSFEEDEYYDIDDFDPPIPYELKIWTTKDGQRVPIWKMDNNHLINTIAYIERKGKRVPYEMEREKYIRKL